MCPYKSLKADAQAALTLRQPSLIAPQQGVLHIAPREQRFRPIGQGFPKL
jgi:hypothetical protein